MRSAFDDTFINDVKRWIEQDGEVYVIVWHTRRGGAKDYLLVSSSSQFSALLDQLRATHCTVHVFRHPQFPLRAIADDTLLHRALASIRDGDDWFIVSSDRDNPNRSWTCGDRSHQALQAAFQELQGRFVAIGPDVHWPEHNGDTENMLSGQINGCTRFL